ncbi:MAG: hypothetical protein J0M12_15085, partial [Deltaproteobacteria bacterium]|nr:hypothetical protein [Deltaproteobacteria bacterium]
MRKLSRHRVGRFLLRLVVSTFIVSAFFVLWQDFLIFPGLYSSLFFNKKNWPPSAVDVLTTNSADGHTVTVWRARAEQEKAVALLFHGNADSVSSFVGVQGWLQSLGISSYSMEYRG